MRNRLSLKLITRRYLINSLNLSTLKISGHIPGNNRHRVSTKPPRDLSWKYQKLYLPFIRSSTHLQLFLNQKSFRTENQDFPRYNFLKTSCDLFPKKVLGWTFFWMQLGKSIWYNLHVFKTSIFLKPQQHFNVTLELTAKNG